MMTTTTMTKLLDSFFATIFSSTEIDDKMFSNGRIFSRFFFRQKNCAKKIKILEPKKSLKMAEWRANDVNDLLNEQSAATNASEVLTLRSLTGPSEFSTSLPTSLPPAAALQQPSAHYLAEQQRHTEMLMNQQALSNQHMQVQANSNARKRGIDAIETTTTTTTATTTPPVASATSAAATSGDEPASKRQRTASSNGVVNSDSGAVDDESTGSSSSSSSSVGRGRGRGRGRGGRGRGRGSRGGGRGGAKVPRKRSTKIAYIEDKSRRHTTFSKRKAGLIKKAYELTTLTGTQALLLIASETGHVYSFATRKMLPFVSLEHGKSLIQACLSEDASSEEDSEDEYSDDEVYE
jgi:SRF-type transcription factor (DNA-binding and dimerisation domain)